MYHAGLIHTRLHTYAHVCVIYYSEYPPFWQPISCALFQFSYFAQPSLFWKVCSALDCNERRPLPQNFPTTSDAALEIPQNGYISVLSELAKATSSDTDYYKKY